MLPLCLLIGIEAVLHAQPVVDRSLFDVKTTIESRSISFENPTGEKGGGGKAASHLGVGRKGFPAKPIAPGETVTLCDIRGSGTIRHIWMTGEWSNFEWLADSTRNRLLRSTVIRAYWDGQKHPSIECPLGDFMGFAHAKIQSYQSAVHSIGENGAFNIWLPMPFTESARLTLSNPSSKSFTLFYQVDYTIQDRHPKDVGRLHVCFRRENPTVKTRDFEILPRRQGMGRFIGAILGVRTLEADWWGEGEIKAYLDGDTEFPTICGTGTEDYVGLSYGIQQKTFLYHGCSLNREGDAQGRNGFISMYRWHLLDPLVWKKECRITIQQIGWNTAKSGNPNSGLYERRDDWSAAAFWYETIPSATLPELPDMERLTADLAD
jgi:hypothetical protein